MTTVKEVVYSSPEKCANLAMACLVLIAVFITMLLLISHPIAITLASIGIVFVVPFAIFFFRRWSSRLPAVTLSPEGITDAAWALGAGLIYWEEIKECAVVRYAMSDWLMFKVDNERSVLLRMPLHRRMGAWIAGLFLPSTVIIPANTIEVSANELLEMVKSYYEKNVESRDHDDD